jgi:hypothetical protein
MSSMYGKADGICGFGTSYPSTPASNVKSTGNSFGTKEAVKGVKNVPLTKPNKVGPKKFSARGK